MTPDADVIISGAGPAGTLAAYELASKGISVLLLEKSRFPRYKVCGGGLTHKILQEIPFDLSPVFETSIHTVHFSCGFREQFTRHSDEPLIYCSMRDRMDQFLLDKALKAGARVLFGEQVMEVSQDIVRVRIKTKSGSHTAKILIGADGASSAVARQAGLRENILPGLAWEAEIKADEEVVKRFSQTVFLDWGAFPGGYGWVFPKGDHFSVGVGGPAALSKWMMPYYDRFLEYFRQNLQASVNREIRLETLSLKSWPIPVRMGKSNFHAGRILVAGDAGGLSDPLTGEGIYYAVKSGKMAARSIREYLEGSASNLESYSSEINSLLMPELLEANKIKHIFNTVPLKIHRFVRDSDRGWRAFGKVLRGERNYADVRMGFGRWKSLWESACRASRWISGMKEWMFLRNGFKHEKR